MTPPFPCHVTTDIRAGDVLWRHEDSVARLAERRCEKRRERVQGTEVEWQPASRSARRRKRRDNDDRRADHPARRGPPSLS